MGKYAGQSWEEIDEIGPEIESKGFRAVMQEKRFLGGEYRLAFGAGWSFKWKRIRQGANRG